MKFIIKNGVDSKNTPANTKDSILLGLKKDFVSGVSVDVRMTCDEKLVIYDKDSIECSPIADSKLDCLRKYNLGSKVKKHYILLLDEVLEIFNNSNKKLIINLHDHGENNKKLVDKVISSINKYPKIETCLNSYVNEIVVYTNDIVKDNLVGAIINQDDSYLWSLDVNLYAVDYNKANPDIVRDKLKSEKLVILENLNSIDDIQTITNYLGDLESKVFIAAEKFSDIESYYLTYQDNNII